MHSCALVLTKYLPLIDEQSSLLQSLGYPLCQLHHSCLTSFSPSPLELVSSEALLNCRASIGHNWLVLNTESSLIIILRIICHPKAYLLSVHLITGNPSVPLPLVSGQHSAFGQILPVIWQVTNCCSPPPENTIPASLKSVPLCRAWIVVTPGVSFSSSRWHGEWLADVFGRGR